MRRLAILTIILITVSFPAFARLGETESECNTRYGGPKKTAFAVSQDKNSPLLPKGYTKTYEYHGWTIRVAFLGFNGPAIMLQFSKGAKSIKDDELLAVLKANLPEGMTWAPAAYKNPNSGGSPASQSIASVGEQILLQSRAWKRSDGAIAQLGPIRSKIVIQAPAADTVINRAKEEKEAQRKAAIPTF